MEIFSYRLTQLVMENERHLPYIIIIIVMIIIVIIIIVHLLT